MSKQKRAMEKQKKMNTPAKKAKRAKKEYYKSPAAKEAWEKKKCRKSKNNAEGQQEQRPSKAEEQRQRSTNRADSQQEKHIEFPDRCRYLMYTGASGATMWCKEGCNVKCPYAGKKTNVPAKCKLPEGEIFGGFWCLFNCKINCPFAHQAIVK